MIDESTIPASASDHAKGFVQHILPHTLLTALMHRASRIRFAPWKNWQIRWFIRRFGVDVSEAANPNPGDYAHFNAFFTRALRDDANCQPGWHWHSRMYASRASMTWRGA